MIQTICQGKTIDLIKYDPIFDAEITTTQVCSFFLPCSLIKSESLPVITTGIKV